MTKARMLTLTGIWLLALSAKAFASGGHDDVGHANASHDGHANASHDGHANASAGHGEHAAESQEPVSKTRQSGPVVAMDALAAKGYHVGELIEAGAETKLLVGRSNLKAELSPRSVVEFDEKGLLRILRGSAMVESKTESSVSTAGARVEFIGKAVVSYDHKEQSSSVFVLDGESRLVNAHRDDSSLRLQRYRGATMIVGDVVPQAIHQLDVGTVEGWLKGFAWPEARRKAMLRFMPGETQVAAVELPSHLNDVKIEDYFSSIDTADEQHQPDYYDKRFQDQDIVVAEQNSKNGPGKLLSPEEAALISLPKTQIDLGFELGPEFVTVDQKMKEVANAEHIKGGRAPASVAKAKPLQENHAKAKFSKTVQGDPDVNLVLQRLKQVRSGAPMATAPARSSGRAPASVGKPSVPDPVYDYSQNF